MLKQVFEIAIADRFAMSVVRDINIYYNICLQIYSIHSNTNNSFLSDNPNVTLLAINYIYNCFNLVTVTVWGDVI